MAIDVWATRRYGNMGGVLQITLIPRQHITVDSVEDFSYTNELNIFFTHQTAQHNEQQKINDIGTLEQKDISFIIPQFRQEVLDYFTANTQYYVLLVKDANGITRKVGTKKRPVRLAYNTETGRQHNDRNQIQVRIEGTHFQKSAQYVPKYRIITPSPSSLAFGSILQGNSTTRTFEIENTGNTTLQITNIVPPSASYSVDWSSGFILAGESQTITVTFSPASAGIFDGNIMIESNATSGTDTIALTATGIAITRIISILPTSLAFGTVEVGNNVTRTFTISNTGNSTLTVSSIGLPAGGYTADWSSGTIAAGASRTITVTFAPSTNGAQDGTININSNKTAGTNTLSTTATGFRELFTFFDGGLNEMRTATTALNFSHTSAYTISVYFRTPNATLLNTTYLFAGSHSDIDNNIYFGIESKGFVFGRTRAGVAQKIRGTTILSPDTLYKVDFVSEGAGASNLKIYVNNALHGTNITANGTITDGAPSTIFYVGALGNLGLRYAGLLGYIRGYAKALTSTERTTQYNSFLPLDIAELVTAWEFQDAQNSATRADSTAGAKTLTLLGYTTEQQNNAQRFSDNSIL